MKAVQFWNCRAPVVDGSSLPSFPTDRSPRGALVVTVGLSALLAHDGSVTEILAALAQVTLVALMRIEEDFKVIQWFEPAGLRVAMRRRQAHAHDNEKSPKTNESDQAKV